MVSSYGNVKYHILRSASFTMTQPARTRKRERESPAPPTRRRTARAVAGAPGACGIANMGQFDPGFADFAIVSATCFVRAGRQQKTPPAG